MLGFLLSLGAALPATTGAASDPCRPTQLRFSEPIVVAEDLGLRRDPGVVGFPIAFSRQSDIHSLRGFRAETRDGHPLLLEMEVLSRWGDGPGSCEAPIRWAYGFIRADPVPKGRTYFALIHDRSEPKISGARVV